MNATKFMFVFSLLVAINIMHTEANCVLSELFITSQLPDQRLPSWSNKYVHSHMIPKSLTSMISSTPYTMLEVR
ncbi:hypothetical protein LXL04_010740 [Taraxacum kok-saghyz]